MLFGYNKPISIDGLDVIAAGSGGAALNDPSYLMDGQPGIPLRVAFGDDVGTTSAFTSILVDLTNSPRSYTLACLLGVTLPIGTRVTLTGREAGSSSFATALGGNTATSRVVEFEDGSRGIWWVGFNQSFTDYDGFAITVYDDVNGLPGLGEDFIFDIGEFAPFQSEELCARAGSAVWTYINPAGDDRTLLSQSGASYERGYRQFSCQIAARPTGGTWGLIDRISARIGGAERVAVVPLWQTGGTLDTDLLHRTSLFGVAGDVPGVAHITRRIFGNERLSVREIPARRYYDIPDGA